MGMEPSQLDPEAKQAKIKELTNLNLIMIAGMGIGVVIGLIIHRLVGGLAIGMLGGFIGRAIYIRKIVKKEQEALDNQEKEKQMTRD